MSKIKVISTIPDFLKADKKIRQQNSATRRFLIWSKLFEKSHQDLFDVYYNWADRQRAKKQFKNYNKNFNKKRIIKNEEYVLKNISVIANKINKFMPFSEKISVVLFVGLNWSNGFVDKYKKKYTTFLNLERYNEFYSLKIFMCHELVHNTHLIKNPIYYWKGNKANWYNALILEGLAVYLTKQVLQVSYVDALWGNYLSQTEKKKFMNWCDKDIEFLKQEFLKEVDKTKRVESKFFGAKKLKIVLIAEQDIILDIDLLNGSLNK
jgi:hypothetical protein